MIQKLLQEPTKQKYLAIYVIVVLISVVGNMILLRSSTLNYQPSTQLKSIDIPTPIMLEPYRNFTQIEADLRHHATPFYMYVEEEGDLYNRLLPNEPVVLKKRFMAEAKQEDQILLLISNHSLRTTDRMNATLFIVPFRVGFGIINKDAGKFRSLARGLLSNNTFQEQPHVLLSLTTVGFNQYHITNTGIRLGLDQQFYSDVSPLIVAQSHDSHSCAKIAHEGQAAATHGHDFGGEFLQGLDHAMSSYGFSIGLLPQIHLSYHEATQEKFQTAKNFIFYHTRTEPSEFNSTRYRQILLEPQYLNRMMNMTNSSIGWGLPPEDWMREFPRSKFCLAIRGDTPHTHALLNAVKVGCIPVVISDLYPVFAPSFPSTLRMEEFCIFIPEKDYIRDPATELLKLLYLSEEEIRRKIEALAFAQKVVVMDHPETLFVEAFLMESLHAYKHPSPPEHIFPFLERNM
jgi:Exostosin family